MEGTHKLPHPRDYGISERRALRHVSRCARREAGLHGALASSHPRDHAAGSSPAMEIKGNPPAGMELASARGVSLGCV